ncbi:hypothetical protein [Nonomuraea sp. LPB2021202275-12-8]|uniref:hypothetical protein n=1 Tax=Nonomuraea sp. LPB2021202275-12-8 TaxID=3120159 RepID=UPI00300D5F99
MRTAVIFSAVPLGSVLGVPAGTLIGHMAGWRAAFTVLGVLAVAVFLALVAAGMSAGRIGWHHRRGGEPMPEERPA